MNKPLLSTLALSAALLTAARADLTVVQKIEGSGQNLQSTTEFKGSKTRVDAAPGMSIIMDLKSGDMINVLREQKAYMKIPAALAQQAVDAMKKMSGEKGDAKPDLKPTGKKDTISGYAAEEYSAVVAGKKMSFWLTKALPNWEGILKEMNAAMSQGPMAAMMQGMGLDMSALPGFPVRVAQDAGDGESITSTVISISAKPIPDADFAIPEGFKEMTMPTLPTGAGAPPSP